MHPMTAATVVSVACLATGMQDEQFKKQDVHPF
jgi:hypothetical protein